MPTTFAAADIHAWGRLGRRRHLVFRPAFLDELVAGLESVPPDATVLAHGLRRSYGDSCLNSGGHAIDMRGLDRIQAFDPATGVLRAEAGISLGAILRFAVPRGFFLPTVPGTRFATLGGAVANDIHGKNHQTAGSLGCHVRRIGLWRSDRGEIELTPTAEPALWSATLGGLGLSGVILWVEIALAPIGSAWLDVITEPFGSLREFWDLNARHHATAEHTVAWIDASARGRALGRGSYTAGRWRNDGRLTPHRAGTRLGVPAGVPGVVFSRPGVRVFNALYGVKERRRAGNRPQHYEPYMFPLDAIADWNRLYGRHGFFQYQCVLPPEAQEAATAELLSEITASGQASSLAVLKTFGTRSSGGLISFPRPGATLALDFANRGPSTLALLSRLDAITRAAGGRVYPAKDARMTGESFRAFYPDWTRVAALKDPRISSDFWKRVTS